MLRSAFNTIAGWEDRFRMQLLGPAGAHDGLFAEQQAILGLYADYEGPGQMGKVRQERDYTPSDVQWNQIRRTVDRLNGVMFNNEVRLLAVPVDKDGNVDLAQKFLDRFSRESQMRVLLRDAGRDALIGKRTSLMVKADKEKGMLKAVSHNSLEFLHAVEDEDGNLIEYILFYGLATGYWDAFSPGGKAPDPSHPRTYRVARWFYETDEHGERTGRVLFTDQLKDQEGNVLSTKFEDHDIGLARIPAVVVVNNPHVDYFAGECEFVGVLSIQEAINKLGSLLLDAGGFTALPMFSVESSADNPIVTIDQVAEWFRANSKIRAGAINPLPAGWTIKPLETKAEYSGALELKAALEDSLAELMGMPSRKELEAAPSGVAKEYAELPLKRKAESKAPDWEYAIQALVDIALDANEQYGIWTDLKPARDSFTVDIEWDFDLFEDDAENDKMLVDLCKAGKAPMRKVWERLGVEESEAEEWHLALLEETAANNNVDASTGVNTTAGLVGGR